MASEIPVLRVPFALALAIAHYLAGCLPHGGAPNAGPMPFRVTYSAKQYAKVAPLLDGDGVTQSRIAVHTLITRVLDEQPGSVTKETVDQFVAWLVLIRLGPIRDLVVGLTTASRRSWQLLLRRQP